MEYKDWYQGMSVKANMNNEYMKGQYRNQHKGQIGTIVTDIQEYINDGDKFCPDTWIEVEWENGNRYCYEMQMLIPISNEGEDMSSWDFERLKNDPARHKKDEIYDFSYPLLAGTRVCLNPTDTSRYNQLKRDFGDTAGYVVDNALDDMTLMEWKSKPLSSRKSFYHIVQLDKGHQVEINVKDLLPVDVPPKDVLKYIYCNGAVDYVLTDDFDKFEEIDRKIIMEGQKLDRTVYFNDEWRKKILDKVDK